MLITYHISWVLRFLAFQTLGLMKKSGLKICCKEYLVIIRFLNIRKRG